MNPAVKNPPVLGFAAWSGTGKTTLLRKLIPALRAGGLRVGIIKHAHHTFDVDQPGKDSYELRHAGAQQVLIGSRRRWALMVEHDQDVEQEPTLSELLQRMPTAGLDLILVEGFKHERFPKVELHRAALAKEKLYPHDDNIIAIATDADLHPATQLPILDLNNIETLTEFVREFATNHADEFGAAAKPASSEGTS
jgi:molybdopterin-guanine dinucleotide biosynthesis protein MobB